MIQPTPTRPGERPLKIDIVVHGRFHGFALARALLALGHDVLLHTNYPGFVVERFGVPRRHVRTFLVHGIGSRALQRIGNGRSSDRTDRWLHASFGAWAARSVRATSDLVHGFSGVMEEFLKTPRALPTQVRTIVRGSAHICEQARLLEEEEARVGVALDRPGRWYIEREEREYRLADKIFVLSSFARQSFIARGVPASRLWTTPLGVDIGQFGATPQLRAARRQRILSGAPLRILTVGTLSFRKGARDLLQVARRLSGQLQFRFVGDCPAEIEGLLPAARGDIEILERVHEHDLAQQYAWGDVFLLPTIEDGFAAVLLQAAAAGLPIIATGNCSAPDFVEAGRSGWLVDIRAPEEIAARLRWCDAHRAELAAVADTAGSSGQVRTWHTLASEMISLWHDECGQREAAAS